MTDVHKIDDLAERVAESVRHALRLVGHAETQVDREAIEPEESAVS